MYYTLNWPVSDLVLLIKKRDIRICRDAGILTRFAG